MTNINIKSVVSIVLSASYLLFLWGLPPVNGTNVADLDSYRDKDGKARLVLNDDGLLKRRNELRPPLNLDDVASGKERVAYTGPVILPDSFEDILNNDRDLMKRGQKNFAGEFMEMALDSKLPTLKQISIFYEYFRDDLFLSQKLSDAHEDLIIVAPTNDAIVRLELKPWQFPEDVEGLENDGALEADIQNAIESNINRFVRSHVIDYDETKSKHYEKFNCILLRSIAMEQSGSTDADILLKKENDKFFIASIKDEKFYPVEQIETGANGVVLIVDTCLVWP